MSDPKIYQLDPGVGDILVQQHDILRLKDKKIKTNGEKKKKYIYISLKGGGGRVDDIRH